MHCMSETNFPLDKILDIDIRDYVESKGKSLGEYDIKGVHTNEKEIEKFAELVPEGTEVVVHYKHDFRVAGAGNRFFEDFHYQSGLALILNKK